jgi:Fic family protein
MPKQLEEMNKNLIYQKIKNYPEGIGIEDLLHSFEQMPAKRTLQRWLSELVKNGEISINGQGRATKYHVKNKIYFKEIEYEIPLSQKSKEYIKIINQPIQKRKPVGYKRSFLDEYRPNVTEYLPKPLKEKLKKIGSTTNLILPVGTYATNILDRLLIDLSWNSSRLEGNTYSLLDTKKLIQFGEVADGKNSFEAQMILNHKEAIEFIVHNSEHIGFNRHTILNLHALLSDNLLINPAACGQLRKIQVAIGLATFEPLNIPQLIEECFQQVLDTAAAIKDPFEQSFFAMVQLPYLQPFEDVNKRVSRLAANIPFIKENLCPLSFIDVPEKIYIDGMLGVYELNKIEVLRDLYEWAYERSCQRYLAVKQSLGEPDLFRLKYREKIIQCVSEIIRKKINKENSEVFIKKFIHMYIPIEDNENFKKRIYLELNSMHEGNIARFRIQPIEFVEWYKKFIK